MKGTHEVAEANENKNAKMRDAFGIKSDFAEGSSFNEEHQKQRRDEEKAAREEKHKGNQAKRWDTLIQLLANTKGWNYLKKSVFEDLFLKNF